MYIHVYIYIFTYIYIVISSHDVQLLSRVLHAHQPCCTPGMHVSVQGAVDSALSAVCVQLAAKQSEFRLDR